MRDVSVSFATTALIQVVNIVTGLIAARLLLPEGRGELAAIILWPGLLAELGNLGLYDALLYRAATRSATPRELFAATMALLGMLSAVLIGVGLVIVPIVFQRHSPEVQTIALYFLCAFLPTYFASLFTSGMFQGQLQIGIWNVLRSFVPITYLATILLLVLLGNASVRDFAIANIAAQAAAATAGMALLIRHGWVSLHARYDVMHSLVVYGAKVHVGEVLYSIRQRIDQVAISQWLPNADYGFYMVALTVANGPLILVITLANVAFPKISQQETVGGKMTVFGRYLRFSQAVAAATILILWILVPWLLPLLFGKPFSPAVPIADVLLLGTLPLAAKLMFQQALKAWDRSLVVGRAEIVGLSVAILAIAFLMPAFGLVGVAWSLVLSQFAAAAMMGFLLQRELQVSLLALFVPTADDWQLIREWVTKVHLRLKFRNG